MLNKKGTDSRRKILDSKAGFDSEVRSLRRTAPTSTFLRAVVVEVITDPEQLSRDKVAQFRDQVSNPDFLRNIPRNSIVARIISGGRDRKGNEPLICYPFLPPYLSLPIKPGEQAWVMYENESASTSLAFWLWRIPEPEHVDDLNYTHGDRRFARTGTISTREKATGDIDNTPSFPNGGGTNESRSLSGLRDYEKIIRESDSYDQFSPEAVPRFVKRPGDSVMQGSNNTLVSLGRNRFGRPENVDGEQAGAIDIVAGRGRFPSPPGELPEGTSTKTVENTRGNLEADKSATRSSSRANIREGDPDARNDAARFFASTSLNADAAFSLRSQIPDRFDDIVPGDSGLSCVVAKADNVRIIARKNEAADINGSIRIIKEGEASEDHCSIHLEPDGAARIEGRVIYIGAPSGSGPGPGGSEPYIKFSEYKSQIEEVIGIVSDLMNVFTQTFVIPDPPVVGGPSPSLTTALSSPGGVLEAITRLEALKARIDDAQSSKIFGE